jgi:mono/diheme cytochrome c family protein
MRKNRHKGMKEERSFQREMPVAGRVIPATSAAGLAALRDGPEPTAGRIAVPLILIVLLGLVIYVADAHMINRGGEFHPYVYYPFPDIEAVTLAHPQDPIEQRRRRGRVVYTTIGCVGCHQATGLGQAGTFPPLAGSEWVVARNPNRLIRIALNGLQGPVQVAGNDFNSNAMVPWKETLNDEKIADLLTYIRLEWGNKAPPVTPDQVRQVRAQTLDRETQWTADELRVVSE